MQTIFRKVVCAFIHIVILAININAIILTWPRNILKSPWLFFTVLFKLVEQFGLTTLIFILWKRQGPCLKMFQLCQVSVHDSGKHVDTNFKTSWTKKVTNIQSIAELLQYLSYLF